MNGAQTSGWAAGTGGNLTPGQLNILILSALAIVILLFSAWAIITAYQGVVSKSLTWKQFIEVAARLVILYLLTLFFFFN
ncbi:TIGR03758 family integrating conjugative element protein [Pantoea stewartii]|uniref:TIGR03758 family integrating conjugative element protein n=1 Tax=Pantoea stewartii TaxID=66269 RepID=UPI00197F4A9F|nr:TIGR03758 family integrating conjugative element protein [Pantoea stewartii]